MLSVGNNIQAVSDSLKAMPVEHLYRSLRSPKPEIETKVRQLRIMREMDPKLYSRSKKLLPYFVCATFNPTFRRTENFAFTKYFIIDLDNLEEGHQDLLTLRSKIEADPRVLLCFISPSEDGLKVMFRLKERCYDAGLYKVFYREFAMRFAQQYHLEQVVDSRTCDVCRACFISIDPLAYYNPEAENVDIEEYADTSDPTALFDQKSMQDKQEAEVRKQQKADAAAESEGAAEPADDELSRIKEVLNIRRQKSEELPKLPIYVPERLEQIMDGLRTFVEDQGISIYDVQNIQYGKKLRAKLGSRLAEVNIFYGKKGFRVVQSIKGILSSELNEVLAEIIQIYLDENT